MVYKVTNISPMCYAGIFIVLGFTFRSLIHFKLIKDRSCFWFCMWISNFFSTICWNGLNGLQSRCQHDCVPSGGSRGESFFFFFSCLIALDRTSNTMLNKSGKTEHPCLGPDLRGSFSFSLLNMILAVGLWHMTLIMLRYVPSITPLLRFLNHK